ncbi:MAG: glutaredoxin family protein [Actinomycetota bacterium]
MSEGIVMYGADWCADCRRAKKVLERLGVAYEYVDADVTDGAIEVVRRYNGGTQTIPVIVFPDGGHLSEPSDEELERRLRESGLA